MDTFRETSQNCSPLDRLGNNANNSDCNHDTSRRINTARHKYHSTYSSLVLIIAITFLAALVQETIAKEIDSKTDLQQEESIPPEHRYVSPGHLLASSSNDNHDLWPQSRGDMPQIKSLNVKCEKNYMKVNVEFDRPFYGMVFSKGHYNDPKCVHLSSGTGQLVANFDIFMNACGMTSSEAVSSSSSSGNGLFIENTIIIQYDSQVQEIWDQARRLRCTWYDYYEKAVTFKPFSVEMQDAVTANFLGDNIQCWMQIQAGKGPWASEVAGIVKIGQTMTMVLAIKDDENKFDMLVRNCVAHDGKHAPINLVDESGCVIRPKIMSKFQKIKNFGHSATVVSYAYFQAFKFPDSMNVHFQCVIQVCRHECPEPACDSSGEYVPPVRETDSTRLVSIGNRTPSTSNRYPIYKPPPSSSSTLVSTYSSFGHRSGEIEIPPSKSQPKSYAAILAMGGMARAMPVNRTKRHSLLEYEEDEDIFKDIQTSEKIIQVVAPGDVAFSLAPSDSSQESWNTTGELLNQRAFEESEYMNAICISSRGLTSGLVFLILVLVISCLISAFLYLRVRAMSKTSYKTSVIEGAFTYDNPEFLSSLTYAGVAGIQVTH